MKLFIIVILSFQFLNPTSIWALDRALFSKEEIKELTYLKSHDYTYFLQRSSMSERSELFFKNLLAFKQKESRLSDKWEWLEKEEKKELFHKLLLRLNEEK